MNTPHKSKSRQHSPEVVHFTIGRDSPTGDALKKLHRANRRVEAINKLRKAGWKIETVLENKDCRSDETVRDDNGYSDALIYWIAIPPFPHPPLCIRTTDALVRKAVGL